MKKIGNKGSITVFLCLLLSSILIICLTVFNVSYIYGAKSKIAMCGRSAVSGVKANYNSYIFENYHILLFDKTCKGMGEGAIEEEIKYIMEHNLGDDYNVEEVAVSEFVLIMSQDCQPLKDQINDYMSYAIIEHGVEKILQVTGDEEGGVSKEADKVLAQAEGETEQMKNSYQDNSGNNPENQLAGGNDDGDSISDSDNNEDASTAEKTEDPRDFTSAVEDFGILTFVLPDELKISNALVDILEVPSFQMFSYGEEGYKINGNFDDFDILKKDLHVNTSWKSNMITGAKAIGYAGSVFNCATDTEVNKNTVFKCEMEYLIGGKASDYDNLENVVNKIILLRLPMNFSYLITDQSKMSKIKAISAPIAMATLMPWSEPVIRYLLAGCWSYGEAMAEVRNLLSGISLPFVKDADSWITDINNLGESIFTKVPDRDGGLGYKDYLFIILAMNMDKTYIRMLDLMELNAGQENESFQIEQGAVGISVDMKIAYKNQVTSINIRDGY